MIEKKKYLTIANYKETNSLCGARYKVATSHIVKELSTNSIVQLTRSMHTFPELCEHSV